MRIPRPPRRLAPCTGVLLALLLAAAPAGADEGHKIIRLCAEGKSLSGFPPSAYAKALKEISATTEEYSECGQLIRQAQAAAAGSKHGSGGGASPTGLSGPVQATPAEQHSIALAATSGSAPVELGGSAVHPGVVHADVASAFSTLPTPLLVLLAFLLACLAAFCVSVARKRMNRGTRPPAD